MYVGMYVTYKHGVLCDVSSDGGLRKRLLGIRRDSEMGNQESLDSVTVRYSANVHT